MPLKLLNLSRLAHEVKQRIVRDNFDKLTVSSPLPDTAGSPRGETMPPPAAGETIFARYESGNEERDSVAFRLLWKLMFDASESVYDVAQTISDADIITMQQTVLDELAALSDPSSSSYHCKVRCLQWKGQSVRADFFWRYAEERMGELVLADMQTTWQAHTPVLCDMLVFPFDDRSAIVSINAQQHADLKFFDAFLFERAEYFRHYLSANRAKVQKMIAHLETGNPLDARNREFELQKTESLNRSNFATLFQSFAHNRFLCAKDMRFILEILDDAGQQEVVRQAFDGLLAQPDTLPSEQGAAL